MHRQKASIESRVLLPSLILVGLVGASLATDNRQITLIQPSRIAGGSLGRVLTDGGATGQWSTTLPTSAIPSFDAAKIGSGRIALNRGGTGGDFSAVLAGSLMVATADGTMGTLDVGAPGQLLTVKDGQPTWLDGGTMPSAGSIGRILYDNGTAWTPVAIDANQIPFWNAAKAPTGVPGLTFDGNSLVVIPSSGDLALAVRSPAGAVLQVGRKATPSGTGQTLGRFAFQGLSNGVSQAEGGALVGVSDGAWTATSTPGALEFRTTPSGVANLPQARWRIDAGGDLANVNALAATDTSGYLNIGAVAGFPTGIPLRGAGSVRYDATDRVLAVFDGARWQSAYGGLLSTVGVSGSVACGASDVYFGGAATPSGAIMQPSFTLPSDGRTRKLTFVARFLHGGSLTIVAGAGATITNGTSNGNASIAITSNGASRTLVFEPTSSVWYVLSAVGS